jgi:hypothetical protein
VEQVFCELRLYGVPRSSILASNAGTRKFTRLGDTPLPRILYTFDAVASCGREEYPPQRRKEQLLRRRILGLVMVMMLVCMSASPAFAGGGGAFHCTTKGVIESCSYGAGGGGLADATGLGVGGGSGGHTTYNTETGYLVSSSGTGGGGATFGGGGAGAHCSIGGTTYDCVGGSSPQPE